MALAVLRAGATINDDFANAGPGDVVTVSGMQTISGALNLNNKNGTADNPITVIFQSGAKVTATGKGMTMLNIKNSHYIVIRGAALEGDGIADVGVYIDNAQYVEFTDFHFKGFTGEGVKGWQPNARPASEMNHHITFRRGLVENVFSGSPDSSVAGIEFQTHAGDAGIPIDATLHHIVFDSVNFKNIRAPADADGIKIMPGFEPDQDARRIDVYVEIRNCTFYRTWKRALKLRGAHYKIENITALNDTGSVDITGGPLIDFQSARDVEASNIDIRCTNCNYGFQMSRYVDRVDINGMTLRSIDPVGTKGRAFTFYIPSLMNAISLKNVSVQGSWKSGVFFFTGDTDFGGFVFEDFCCPYSIDIQEPKQKIVFKNSTLCENKLTLHDGVRLESITYSCDTSMCSGATPARSSAQRRDMHGKTSEGILSSCALYDLRGRRVSAMKSRRQSGVLLTVTEQGTTRLVRRHFYALR